MSHPPFRADHVGSLLRPLELLQARSEREAGRLSAEELRRVEDVAIRDAVRMQEEIGLQGVTDGEYRRGRDDRSEAAHPISERSRAGRGRARSLSHRRQADPQKDDL